MADDYDIDPEMLRLLMGELAGNLALCRVLLLRHERLPRHALAALFCALVDLNGACIRLQADGRDQGAMTQ